MKKGFKTFATTGILFSTVVLTGFPSTALAEEEKPSAEASIGFYSQYVWRGWAFSKDSLVIQPSLSTGYKGFGLNLWGNLDTNETSAMADSASRSDFNETDLTLSYDGTYGKFGYGGGYIYYGLEGHDSQELYINLSYDILLSPTLTLYKEITGIQGWYANFGVGHSFPLTEKIGLDLGASFGYYDNEQSGADEYSEFHDGRLSAVLTIPVNDYFSVSPEIYWSFPLSSKAKDVLKAGSWDNDNNHVYGGVSLSMSF